MILEITSVIAGTLVGMIFGGLIGYAIGRLDEMKEMGRR